MGHCSCNTFNGSIKALHGCGIDHGTNIEYIRRVEGTARVRDNSNHMIDASVSPNDVKDESLE